MYNLVVGQMIDMGILPTKLIFCPGCPRTSKFYYYPTMRTVEIEAVLFGSELPVMPKALGFGALLDGINKALRSHWKLHLGSSSVVF
ncbi:hypothetical protein SAMN05421688_1923 [Poseidonocella pacifica]|uniref:Uncharacterized protein n=1 Tax=Poseidonocella pacifica TaxID=871651 RepID=A0A1I0X6J1_9RHOB|nr:hypothetical protein SAMN05421688_1923 [Poseidonocella pacifica]